MTNFYTPSTLRHFPNLVTNVKPTASHDEIMTVAGHGQDHENPVPVERTATDVRQANTRPTLIEVTLIRQKIAAAGGKNRRYQSSGPESSSYDSDGKDYHHRRSKRADKKRPSRTFNYSSDSDDEYDRRQTCKRNHARRRHQFYDNAPSCYASSPYSGAHDLSMRTVEVETFKNASDHGTWFRKGTLTSRRIVIKTPTST